MADPAFANADPALQEHIRAKARTVGTGPGATQVFSYEMQTSPRRRLLRDEQVQESWEKASEPRFSLRRWMHGHLENRKDR